MAEKYSFFNAELVDGNYDRTYLAEDYARYFASFIGNGIYPQPSSTLQVMANGTDMKITIKAGKAWINGYFYENDDNLVFTVSNADGVLNRIDSVVIRLDLVNRNIKMYIKKGVFAVNPVVPDITRNADTYEIQLATIYVGTGVTSITQSNITDTRLNNTLCGIVAGVVDQIDTTGLFAQYNNEFNTWFTTVQGQLNEDIAGQLNTRVTNIENGATKLSATSTLMSNGTTVETAVNGKANGDSSGNAIKALDAEKVGGLPFSKIDTGNSKTWFFGFNGGEDTVSPVHANNITVGKATNADKLNGIMHAYSRLDEVGVSYITLAMPTTNSEKIPNNLLFQHVVFTGGDDRLHIILEGMHNNVGDSGFFLPFSKSTAGASAMIHSTGTITISQSAPTQPLGEGCIHHVY